MPDPETTQQMRKTAREVIDAAICERYPELADSDFPENFGAIVEEALAHHDYQIVSTASRMIHDLREKYRPGRA